MRFLNLYLTRKKCMATQINIVRWKTCWYGFPWTPLQIQRNLTWYSRIVRSWRSSIWLLMCTWQVSATKWSWNVRTVEKISWSWSSVDKKMLICCWGYVDLLLMLSATTPTGIEELIELDSITCDSYILGIRLYIYTWCKHLCWYEKLIKQFYILLHHLVFMVSEHMKL